MNGGMFTCSPLWNSPYLSPNSVYPSYADLMETTLLRDTIPKNYISNRADSLFEEAPASISEMREGIPKMELEQYKEDKSDHYRRAVVCREYKDLSSERILKSLSIMKSKLLMDSALIKIEKIECKMSPMVKNNIIKAYRKVSMYGKKTPFVACFDDYGRRLPDEIKIDTIRGVDLKIVNPIECGDNYLSFEVIGSKYKSKGSIFDDAPF